MCTTLLFHCNNGDTKASQCSLCVHCLSCFDKSHRFKSWPYVPNQLKLETCSIGVLVNRSQWDLSFKGERAKLPGVRLTTYLHKALISRTKWHTWPIPLYDLMACRVNFTGTVLCWGWCVHPGTAGGDRQSSRGIIAMFKNVLFDWIEIIEFVKCMYHFNTCVNGESTNESGFLTIVFRSRKDFFCYHETVVIDAFTLFVSHSIKVRKDRRILLNG